MIRALAWIAWLVTGGVVAAWFGHALLGVDQSEPILPFSLDAETDIIPVGIGWALLGGFLALSGGGRRRPKGERTQLAVGTVIETRSTGWTVNDAPQHDVYLDVTPTRGEPFVASFRDLFPDGAIAAFAPGTPVPVLYDPQHTEEVSLADVEEPSARDALLDWRIERRLVPPELVRARLYGTPQPASVVAVRPTGARRDGQVELALTLLITPEDGSPQREAETHTFVFPGALSHLQVGSPVFAMYEPGRPQQVAMTIVREEPRR